MVGGRIRKGLVILAAIAAGLILAVVARRSHADGARPRAGVGLELLSATTSNSRREISATTR